MYMCGIHQYDFFAGSGGYFIHEAKLLNFEGENKNTWLNI